MLKSGVQRKTVVAINIAVTCGRGNIPLPHAVYLPVSFYMVELPGQRCFKLVTGTFSQTIVFAILRIQIAVIAFQFEVGKTAGECQNQST